MNDEKYEEKAFKYTIWFILFFLVLRISAFFDSTYSITIAVIITTIQMFLLIATAIGIKQKKTYGPICGIIFSILMLFNLNLIYIIVGIVYLIANINVLNHIKNTGEKTKRITKIIIIVIIIAIFVLMLSLGMYVLNMGEKPIIYLYPTEETEVTVQLGNVENITCSYPNYKGNGWNVLAKPNGDLTDLSTGRSLYSLYYESRSEIDFKVETDGFCIKGEDTANFLEEKLELLGLTERESEEFIVYWLPRLQKNEYNYIRFATIDEINENMPLSFSVEPDTIIRVLMTYKGLNSPINVEEQQIETPERTGFVAVEWGGTEMK